jgi:hypothetical protein
VILPLQSKVTVPPAVIAVRRLASSQDATIADWPINGKRDTPRAKDARSFIDKTADDQFLTILRNDRDRSGTFLQLSYKQEFVKWL